MWFKGISLVHKEDVDSLGVRTDFMGMTEVEINYKEIEDCNMMS